jgi:phage shock protein A
MGIFQKLSTLLKSNLNDLIARAENPEKMLNQVIVDMREQLTKAKQEVAVAIADERKLKAQVEEETRQANEWEKRAMLAVRQDRDDMARQALVRQQEYAQRAQTLHETWERQAAETEKLKDALRQLNLKIEEAQRKKNLLIAKQRRAQAQQRIHETMSGLSDSSAFEAFNRMAERIEQNERLALASAEVSDEITGDPLDREFKALEKGGGEGEMEYRLLSLKQQMGILPPPAPAEQGRLGNGEAARQLGAGAQAQAGAPAQAAGGQVRDAELLEEFEALEEEERGHA